MKPTVNQSGRLHNAGGRSNQQKFLAWKEKPEKLFEEGEFELWYQPVYQAESGEVIHNEVLLRWRDSQGELYLPKDFMPAISKAGLLPRVDRLVISKTIESLTQNPELELSVNLSDSTLKDLSLIDDLQSWLGSAGVEPRRLSFEVTEAAIARDFDRASKFIKELKNLGCRVVIDDFSSQELPLTQCQQLNVDSVKLNQEFLEKLDTALARAIVEFGHSLGSVTAKCITDDNTLRQVKEAGLSRVQGNHLKMATPHPAKLPWHQQNQLEIIDLTALPTPPKQEKTSIWTRLLVGASFIGLGAAALTVGMLSVGYRMSNLIVDNGAQINGRILRLRAPIDGKLESFYPSPGVSVKAGQVLARIGASDDVEQKILLLEQEVQSKSNQLSAASESLAFLQNRLRKQEGEYDKLWDVEIAKENQDVSQKKAFVDGSLAEARAARANYDRYQKLYDQGITTKQQLERVKAEWETAEASVRRARDILDSSESALAASEQRVAMNFYANWADSYVKENTNLRQQIENQSIMVKTLRAELEGANKRLLQARTLYSTRKDVEIKAPISAIVNTTDRQQGELIKQSEEILSLLDCNNIWVEATVNAKKATLIDTKRSVLVKLAGETQPIEGEVTLIQAISSQGDFERSQKQEVEALSPLIPPDLVGEPLSRIKVKIPPPQNFASDDRFCGLGQPARLTFGLNQESLGDRILNWRPDWLKKEAPSK